VISRADSEITERDLTLALEAAETAIPPAMALNKKIINTVPIEYKIDGKLVWGETVGLKAPKLEVKALFIACQEQHLSSLIHTVEMAGVEVVDVIAAPVALSCVALSKKQKRAGCLLVDLGAETLSMVVFENNNLISLEVFPFGGDDVTNDIALGLKISPDDAENIKRGTDRRLTYPRKKIEDIIRSRLVEYFAHVETHLKAIGRNALLPAGVIIAGGGALTMEIKDVAEHALKLPSQLVEVSLGTSTDGKIKDHTWAVACGLAIIGLQTDGIEHSLGIHNGTIFKENSKRWGKAFLRWISQFLP
jgi:cell division protein FtsA